MRSCLTLTAIMAISLAACGLSNEATPGTVGELGNGLFSYGCASDSDPICDGGSGPQVLPRRVALASRFSMTYTPSDATEGSATVESVSEDFLIESNELGAAFKAVHVGTGGLLARRGNTVVDIIHLDIAPVDHVQIDASGDTVGDVQEGVVALTLPIGRTVRLRALAVDQADETLAGALSCRWSSAEEGVARIITLATDNEVTVEAAAVGAAVLRVELEDLTAEVAVTVVDEGGGQGGSGGAGWSGGGQ